MKLRMFVLSVCGLLLASCGGVSDVTDNEAAHPPLCSNAWYQSVEQRVTTGDVEAHGPDIGTDEWKSVVEFRLDVRGEPDVPDRSSSDWCFFIESLIPDDEVPEVGIQQPSFDCSAVAEGSVESMICGNVDLTEMDRQLAAVYDQATQIAANEEPQALRAEQIGWIRGRDECWQATHQLYCIYGEYQRRIAELEARYRLVPFVGPMNYSCEGNPANEILVTFFETEPKTLIAERGDSVSLMFAEPTASGARYIGRNESFWEHQGEVQVVWGYEAPAMLCETN